MTVRRRPAAFALLAWIAFQAVEPAVVMAQAEPASTVSPEPTATPLPVVAVPEITARIEETDALLRRIERIVPTPPLVAAVEKGLPEFTRAVEDRKDDPERLLAQGAPPRVIEYLNATWQGIRDELAGWSKELTKRAVELESALQELSAQRDLWAASRAEAAASQAPPELLKRIDATVESIRQLQDKLGAERKQTLILQSKVAAEVGPTDKILAELGAARLARVGRTLERDSPPLWNVGRLPSAGEMLGEIRDLVRYKFGEAGAWLSENRGRVLAATMVLLGTALLLGAAGRRWEAIREGGESGSESDGEAAGDVANEEISARVLRTPWAAAIVLVLVAIRLRAGSGQIPELLDQGTMLLVLPAAARLLMSLSPPGLGPLIAGFIGFLLVDLVRGSLLAVPEVERLWLIAELVFASACLGAFAFGRSGRMDRWRKALGVPRVRELAMLALAASAAALIAAVAGWMELARLLGSAVLSTVALGVVFGLVARILDAMVGVLLRVPPIGTMKAVVQHRALVESRLRYAIEWLAIAAWAFAVLRSLAVGHIVLETVKDVLATRIGTENLSVGLGDLIAFGLTIWLATIASRFLRFVLEEEVYPHWELPRGIPFAISTVLHYAILGTGFVLALGALGLDLNRFTVLAGAFGLGIGFGLQNIVNNFVSGLILLFERPIQVGDEVQLGELVGEVRHIGVRSSTVRTPRGADVIVPNGNLISDRVTNWTRPDRLRRIDVVVSTKYGADPEKVLGLLREVARTHPAVLADPPPVALLTRFAENTVWFELRAWTNRLEQVAVVTSELHLRVYRGLEGAGFLPG